MNRRVLLAAFLMVAVAFLSLGFAATASATTSAKLCKSDADCGPHFVCCPRGYCGSPSICRL